jgi:hypothetical protein
MADISIPAHFDGEPFELEPDTKLLVTVLPKDDAERAAWLRLSGRKLAAAYAADEAEY